MASGDDRLYLSRFFRQSNRFPTLRVLHRYLRKESPKSKPHQHSRRRDSIAPKGRVAVIEFSEDERLGEVIQVEKHFHGVEELVDYLSNRRKCRRRLFMMEDLWLPYVEAFGHALDVDPRVFASQYRCVHWDNLREGVQRRLRSCRVPDGSSDYYTLKYFEIWNLEEPELESSDTFGDNGNWSPYYQTLGDPSRELVLSTMPLKRQRHGSTADQRHDEFRAYLLRGNASFWYRTYDRDPNTWDALMLLDPPMGNDVTQGGGAKVRIRKRRYQGGYPDLMEWRRWQNEENCPGPNQESLFDDILYYWRNDPASAKNLKTAAISATYMKQLVATHWNCTLNSLWGALSYLEFDIGRLEENLSVHDDSQKERFEWHRMEANLRRMNTLRRRLNWYLEEAKENLFQLRIGDQPKDDLETDFKDIADRLELYKSCSDNLMEIAGSVASLRQTKQGLVTSYFINLLTMLGVVIFPLTFLCGIFSMGGDFQAGQSLFWIYWVIAIPLGAAMVFLVWGGKKWYMQRQKNVEEPAIKNEQENSRSAFGLESSRGGRYRSKGSESRYLV